VRTHGIVVRPPCLDDPSCCSQRWEQELVQTLVAQAANKALNEAVLLRLVRRELLPLDPCILAPCERGVTGQLDAVVADHYAQQPATLGDDAQLANDPPTRQRGVDDAVQAFLL
jgi:hypothetical protein